MPDVNDHAPNCPRCDEPMQKSVIIRLPLTQPRVDNTNTFFALFCPACGQVLHRGELPAHLYAHFFSDEHPHGSARP